MNQIHGRFAISNENFLYVLSTFDPLGKEDPVQAFIRAFTARYGAHRFYRDGKKSMPVYAFNQTSLFLQPLSVISTPKS